MSEHFVSEVKQGLNIITCPAVMDSKSVTNMESCMSDWLSSQSEMHILDMAHVVEFSPSIYRPITKFHNELEKQRKLLSTINIPAHILPLMKMHGIDKLLNPINSIDEALDLLHGHSTDLDQTIEIRMLDVFKRNITRILSEMGIENIKTEKYEVLAAGKSHHFQVAGQMKFKTKNEFGSAVLHFQAPVFKKICSDLFMIKDVDQHQELAKDAAGELINMIFGQSKSDLNEKLNLSISSDFPEVFLGENITIHDKIQAYVIPFKSSVGNFYFELGFVRMEH